MANEQFNLRLSKTLLDDMRFIERVTGLDKSNWVRYILTESTREEKNRLLQELEEDYILGRIDYMRFERLYGKPPSEALNVRRIKYQDYGKLAKTTWEGLLGQKLEPVEKSSRREQLKEIQDHMLKEKLEEEIEETKFNKKNSKKGNLI